MDIKTVENIVYRINNYKDAQMQFKKLSSEELIDLKAMLKGKSIYFDNWLIIAIPVISIVIAALSIIISTLNADRVSVFNIVMGLMMVVIGVFLIHVLNQKDKEKYILTLSYLEDFLDENKKCDINISKSIKKTEKVRNQNSEELIKLQNYINKE